MCDLMNREELSASSLYAIHHAGVHAHDDDHDFDLSKRLFYNDCSRVRDLGGSLLRKFMAPGGVVRSN